eukprot:1059202-Amphidinium_carterae.1
MVPSSDNFYESKKRPGCKVIPKPGKKELLNDQKKWGKCEKPQRSICAKTGEGGRGICLWRPSNRLEGCAESQSVADVQPSSFCVQTIDSLLYMVSGCAQGVERRKTQYWAVRECMGVAVNWLPSCAGVINSKIFLLNGSLLSLQVDAMIAPCAANYSIGTSFAASIEADLHRNKMHRIK